MQKHHPVESSSSLENLLKAYMAKNDVTLRNLENQMRQLANELTRIPLGAFPNDTVTPRSTGKEPCEVVTLRSGKMLKTRTVEIED